MKHLHESQLTILSLSFLVSKMGATTSLTQRAFVKSK